jgi:antitoxin CptB
MVRGFAAMSCLPVPDFAGPYQRTPALERALEQDAPSAKIPAPMIETPDIRRKRLLFRSWHRGTREADLLLGPFAERHLGEMTLGQLDLYEALLEENDATLYDWISGRAEPPAERDSAVLRSLMKFRNPPRPA